MDQLERMSMHFEDELMTEDMENATKDMIEITKEFEQSKLDHAEEERKVQELKQKYNVNVPVILAEPAEELWHFLERLKKLRDEGKEVVGVFCGIKFSNMADNLYEAYIKAEFEYHKELERTRPERMKQEAKKRIEEITALINELPENASNYTLEDIVNILYRINDYALSLNYNINLTQDLCAKLFHFLTSAGFNPVSDDHKYINAGIINMHTYAPPAPPGKKTIELPWISGCAIYVPQNFDLNDFEQMKLYIIGNFMSQLRDGKLDVANLELFNYLSNKIKDNQETMKR